MNANDLGRAAFWKTSISLSSLLVEAYPTGCTLAEAIEWAGTLDADTVAECEVIG